MNFSAHRPLTEMAMERYCPEDLKKYKTSSVGRLWAEQFTKEVGSKISKILEKHFLAISDKIKITKPNFQLVYSEIMKMKLKYQMTYCNK